MSAVGFSWPINATWLHSFVVALLLVPLGLLLVRVHQSHNYGPFILGLVAAVAMYLCKFRFVWDAGTYFSGATLFAATLWSTKANRVKDNELTCRC